MVDLIITELKLQVGSWEGPPVFGRTVNSISTKGSDYAHQSTTSHPGSSDLATALKDVGLLWKIFRKMFFEVFENARF